MIPLLLFRQSPRSFMSSKSLMPSRPKSSGGSPFPLNESKLFLKILSMPLGSEGNMPPGLFMPLACSSQKQSGQSRKTLMEEGDNFICSIRYILPQSIKHKGFIRLYELLMMQNNTKPLHYDIKFGVDMEGFEFFGAETVEVFTAKPAGKIVMNSSGLDIISCSVFSGGKEIASSFRTIGEELVIEIKSKISGKASISLEFRGKLEDG